MAAVFLYGLYRVEAYPLLAWLETKRDVIRPYMLATSQWQRWNLFSPDPLRLVIEMDIDAKMDGNWKTIRTINEHTLSWWRRAPELKIIRRMNDDGMGPLQLAYVFDVCRTQDLPSNTPIRLRKRSHVIPEHGNAQTGTWLAYWKPDWSEQELLSTTCPESM